MWQVFEPIHAVTYFAPEPVERLRDLGYRGYWMGYFASRSAPFGEASPQLVTATFFNFRPSMVHRALPDAWGYASPEAALAARLDGTLAALRRALGDAAVGPDVAEAAEVAEAAADACPPGGRPLFAALSAVAPPGDPLGRLWHAATRLREHRGDGHIVANLAHGVDGLGAHVMFAATAPVDRAPGWPGSVRAILQGARKWTDDEWEAAAAELTGRGWLTADGAITDVGRAARQAIEDLTDDLAAGPWESIGAEATGRLRQLLAPLAQRIVADGDVPVLSPAGDLTDG